MGETEYYERRQHKRITFIKEVEVPGAGILQCSDLNPEGMFLETVQYYPVGTILDLKFKLQETDTHPINAQARVIYRHMGIGVGLYFSGLKQEDRQKIEDFIEQT